MASGNLLPADIVSRETSTTELETSMWFTGPPFLTQPISQFPKSAESIDINLEVVKAEQRRSAASFTTFSNYRF